jgi:4-hydroxy-tetrahydrodipicolinate reductase
MGRALQRLIAADGRRPIPVDARTHPDVGRALDEALPTAALVLDFSSPEGTLALLERLPRHPAPCVIGTTGLDARHEAGLATAAARAPLVCATNYSVGMNLLWLLAERAAAALDPAAFDVEIVEAHHRHKKDAPSGSARTLFEHVQAGRARAAGDPAGDPAGDLAGHPLHHGPGIGEGRPTGGIGIASLRGGDVVGEHTVYFFGDGERLELAHRATDRVILARGAWLAARWLSGRTPGRYTMRDVLGL